MLLTEKLPKYQALLLKVKALNKDAGKLIYYRDQAKNSFTMSKAKNSNLRSTIDTLAGSVEMLEHEIHCLCVQTGLALYDAERYGTRERCTNDGYYRWKVEFKPPEIN